jgi:hypothetical protein
MMSSPRALDAGLSTSWLRRFVRTTPGLFVLVGVAIAAFCLVAGLVCAAAMSSRIAREKAILDHSEPFVYAAQNLYAALSAADAAAATSFLSGGAQTPLLRARYQQALAAAASSLTDATAGAPDAGTRKTLAEISARLATYTGLVEAARANNVQNFPIGSAYLREASSLMQTGMLPEAETILTADLARVDHAQRRVASLPVVGLTLLAGVLVAIVGGSAVLFARTNRQFNLGLVAAAVATVLLIGWIVVATRLAAGDIDYARTEGTARFGQLAEARILAQQARTDETLQLITRGDINASEKTFYGHVDDLTSRVGADSAAAAAVQAWVASHRAHVEAYRAGDYPRAVAQAISTDDGGSARRFAVVEEALRNEIEAARAVQRSGVADAGDYLGWLPTGAVVLMALGASATVLGLWPRLKEFL